MIAALWSRGDLCSCFLLHSWDDALMSGGVVTRRTQRLSSDRSELLQRSAQQRNKNTQRDKNTTTWQKHYNLTKTQQHDKNTTTWQKHNNMTKTQQCDKNTTTWQKHNKVTKTKQRDKNTKKVTKTNCTLHRFKATLWAVIINDVMDRKQVILGGTSPLRDVYFCVQ